MKSMLAAAAVTIAAIVSSQAEVRTYQGSTRWATTYFTPNVRTTSATTSYTTYYIVEIQNDMIVGAVKIDAWMSRTGNTLKRRYFVDNSFEIDYGFFGTTGGDIAGGIRTNSLEATLAFRGSILYGDLGAFTLYPATDYYPNGNNLDVTAVSGSARLNTTFSGTELTLETAANEVLDYLESRGYSAAN